MNSELMSNLNADWKFRLAHRRGDVPVGMDAWMPATVPGSVHYQLQKAGKIPDPWFGQNELQLQWIDQQDWEWMRTVAASAEDCSRTRQELIFDGIDTVARIFLNGQIIGVSENMFRQVVCDVRGILKHGNNELRVLISSPTEYAVAEFERGGKRVVMGDFTWVPGETRLTGRAWIRKVQCHFGWDWGVYLATSGIWQGVRLERSDAPRISAITVDQEHIGPVGKPDRVNLKITAYLDTPAPVHGTLNASCEGISAQKSMQVGKGETKVEMELSIDHPKLWWPNGQGEQPLYLLKLQWKGEKGELSESQRRIGLRTLELIREPDKTPEGEPAESFYFRINGRPIFAKGANWIPADQFVERCTPGVYRHLLGSMIEANMNMIRVWGGGWYEQDSFYDLCDELGILVWQDFMMACALYPDTKKFLDEMTAEAKYQVRRLHTRPSIAIWCGDNEDMGAVYEWWRSSPDFPKNTQIYIKVMTALKHAVEAEDSTRKFWLSSPCNGEFGEHPGNPNIGDVHYWKVWHQKQPFSNYLTVKPRFASEFGFQSFPEPRTIRACIPVEELNPSSRVMEHHQRSPDGNMLITNTIAREMPIPKDLDAYCWVSQINHAIAMKTAVEHWRRLRPWCMGTLYWQLNDLWPVASWSSIDYHGRWKVLQHFAQRFFSPILTSLIHEDDSLTAWATSDVAKNIALSGSLDLFDWNGKLIASRPLSSDLKPGESRAIAKFSVKELLGGKASAREVCAFIQLRGERHTHQNFTVLVPWKWAPLPAPKISVELGETNGAIQLTATSKQVIPFFHAEIEGEEGHFSGDWQVLRPGETYTFKWIPHENLGARMPALSQTRTKLKKFSLYDTYAHE